MNYFGSVGIGGNRQVLDCIVVDACRLHLFFLCPINGIICCTINDMCYIVVNYERFYRFRIGKIQLFDICIYGGSGKLFIQ